MEKLESVPSPENMEKASRIVLHFLRHGKKGKAENDYEVRLTPEGRKEAVGKAAETNVSQAMAFGSPRKRTQESAALMMAGAEDDITGDESFEELAQKLNEGIKVGSKIFADKRLDFTIDESSPAGQKEMEAYTSKRWMPFLINESDNLAKVLDDKGISTYSRMAGAVADIVRKYIEVEGRWHGLVNDEGKKYDEMLERFLGSHQGVTESFLSKIIEKTQGSLERDKFVAAVNNQGFDFLEGFDVEIKKNSADGAPAIRIKFEKKDDEDKVIFSFDQDVPASVIDEISAEGEA